MKILHCLLLAVCSLMLVTSVFPQGKEARLRAKGFVNPQEIVSLDSTMRMDQALLVIGELSKQFAGKIIIDLDKRKSPIGVYVVNQHWRDALDMILTRNGLTYSEETEFIRILPLGASIAGTGKNENPSEPPPTLNSRDVKISVIFFSTNLQKLQNYGISWSFFRSKKKEPTENGYLSAGIIRGDTLSLVPPTSPSPSLSRNLVTLSSPPEFTFANIDALIKFFATNQLGDVVTSPEIVVRNGKKGRIQVGKNIFITTRDVGGNAISSQIQTGTIIDVTPVIYTQADTNFVYLDLQIEQSDAALGQTGTEINKSSVQTHTLLYDGEESIIGGLYTTTEQEIREGIPILKDLPWWFFGLRYVFGSEAKIKQKNELIILLKAELLSPLRKRISSHHSDEDIINSKRTEFQKEFDKK